MTYTADTNTDGELIAYNPDLSIPNRTKKRYNPHRKIHRTTFAEDNKMELSPVNAAHKKLETTFSELSSRACHIEQNATTKKHHQMAIDAWIIAKKAAPTDKKSVFCDQRIHLNRNKITIWGNADE